MNHARIVAPLLLLALTVTTGEAQVKAVPIDVKASDGTVLKASYFAAAKPGPGVLLFHQSNRTRQAWNEVAAALAAAGIHTLTIDLRGFGDTGGTPPDKRTDEEWARVHQQAPGDLDAA